MLVIGFQFLAAWAGVAVIVGLAMGASIRSAERLRTEALLTNLFSYLARTHSTR